MLPHVDRDVVHAHTLTALSWWKSNNFQYHQLKENMRAKHDHAFADFCLSVGNGELTLNTDMVDLPSLCAAVVTLPSSISAPTASAADLLSWVYEGYESVLPAAWPQFYSARATLAPTNEACDELNSCMLAQLDSTTDQISFSVDTQDSEVESLHGFSQEFLNSLQPAGLPPHQLRLRRGALVILLRNYAPHKGLCNGTRLVVDKIVSRLLIVRVVTGPACGNVEAIPRICCDSSGNCELPFCSPSLEPILISAFATALVVDIKVG